MLSVVVFIVAVAGCDRYTKHEVLTFFFTGVPSPEEEERAAAEPREPDDPPESLLRPAVLTTHASALLHSGSYADLPEIWDEVLRKAAGLEERAGAEPGSTVAEMAQELRWRALAGHACSTR